ncbi:hypothetical protein ACFTY7_24955 [Streptomyces sp. NPDC057062]|uniref:hypothetical protein n=1 Tax=Streptomyces sp. NPDC057062 TaxID=3346011 RepID=UPI00362CFF32
MVVRSFAASDLVRAIDGVVIASRPDRLKVLRLQRHCHGPGEAATERAPRERPLRTAPHSWEPRPEEAFVRIEPELVTGGELVGGCTAYVPALLA